MAKPYIVLHKSEWERLHRKTDGSNQLPDQRDEYFRKLIELSQSWIKTWPDTVQGHVEQVAKQKEKRHQEEIATVKKGLKKKKQADTKEAIKRARELIFDDSCYGRKLLSALLESKNLEILDIQTEFEKEIKEKNKKHEQEMLSKLKLDRCSFNLDKNEQEVLRKNREMEMELAQINKSMHEMEINKKKKKKEEQQIIERDNAQLTQKMLAKEAEKEKEYDISMRQDLEYYEREQRLAREHKANREKSDEARASVQQKELERKYYKISKVMKQLHNNQNTEHYKRNYESIEKLQKQKHLHYEEFVEKGVKELMERTAQKDQEDAAKIKLQCENRKDLAKSNKLAADEVAHWRKSQKLYNKCVGDRQCILPKSCGKRKEQQTSGIKEKRPSSFLSRTKTLQEQLQARRAAPSPWGAAGAAHAHFAERAADTLRECRHKRFARKVVYEYRKSNHLDEMTLPVPNY